jgi:hypothetical protein
VEFLILNQEDATDEMRAADPRTLCLFKCANVGNTERKCSHQNASITDH